MRKKINKVVVGGGNIRNEIYHLKEKINEIIARLNDMNDDSDKNVVSIKDELNEHNR